MAGDADVWNELRTQGRWIEMWETVRRTGTVDDLIALADDLSAEERAADEAARLAWSTTQAVQRALKEASGHPAQRIFERIESAEGSRRRQQAEVGVAQAAAVRSRLPEQLSA